METRIILVKVNNAERGELKAIENKVFNDISEIKLKSFETLNLSEFMELCNDGDLWLDGYWMGYIQLSDEKQKNIQLDNEKQKNIQLINDCFAQGFKEKRDTKFPHYGKTIKALENMGFVYVNSIRGLANKIESEKSEDANYYYLQKDSFHNIEVILFGDETVIVNYNPQLN